MGRARTPHGACVLMSKRNRIDQHSHSSYHPLVRSSSGGAVTVDGRADAGWGNTPDTAVAALLERLVTTNGGVTPRAVPAPRANANADYAEPIFNRATPTTAGVTTSTTTPAAQATPATTTAAAGAGANGGSRCVPHNYEQSNPLHVTGPTHPEDPNAPHTYAAVDYDAVGGGGGGDVLQANTAYEAHTTSGEPVHSYSDGTVVNSNGAVVGGSAGPKAFAPSSAPLARRVSTYDGFGAVDDSAV